MWRHRSLGRALVVTVVLVGGFVASLGQPAAAEGSPPPQAFVVVDATTGAVLTSRALHRALPPRAP
jgi:D-alanyl-D-alanine carboxypeptidase